MALVKEYRNAEEPDYYVTSEIRTLANMLGMSDEGIRSYERNGLVSPNIKDGSGRRMFDIMDFTMLLYSRVYRKSDFTMKEISEIVNGNNLAHTLEMYQNKIAEEQAEIQRLTRTISCLTDVTDSIKSFDDLLGKCRVEAFPGLFRMEFMFDGDIWHHDSAMSAHISEWVNYAPCSMISTRYFLDDFRQRTQPKRSFSGLGIYPKYAESLGVRENEYVKYYPPCERALHTILAPDNLQLIADMQFIFDYLEANHLEPNGDAVTLGILNTNFDTLFTRYLHLWLPLKD